MIKNLVAVELAKLVFALNGAENQLLRDSLGQVICLKEQSGALNKVKLTAPVEEYVLLRLVYDNDVSPEKAIKAALTNVEMKCGAIVEGGYANAELIVPILCDRVYVYDMQRKYKVAGIIDMMKLLLPVYERPDFFLDLRGDGERIT